MRRTHRRVRALLRQTALRPVVVALRHRGLQPSDSYLACYPRSGSTWLRFLIYDALSREDAHFGTVNRHLPDVGRHRQAHGFLPGEGRLIKTHEPYRLVYKRGVYLVRDPRDVVVSEYRYWKMTGYYDHGFATFVDDFTRGQTSGYGSWTAHVDSWLDGEAAIGGRLLVVRFEDLRQDAEAVLRKAVEFLGRPVDAEQARQAVARNTLSRMAAKEEQAKERMLQRVSAQYRFVNRGSTDQGGDDLDADQREAIDRSFGATMARVGYST